MARERKIKYPFESQKDDSYTTGHIKAARKIMQVLLKIKASKLKAQESAQSPLKGEANKGDLTDSSNNKQVSSGFDPTM